jgi:hypothetical protein
LLKENRYKGKDRKAIAIGLGKLLSYRMDVIRERLENAGK